MKRNQLALSYTKDEFVNLLDRLDNRPFVLYYDRSSSLYRLFPTEDKRDAWVQAYEAGDMSEEIASYEFTEPFTAPAPYTINLYSLKDNQYVLKDSTGNYLEYQFNTVDGNGGEISESVDVYYTFKSPSGTVQTSKVYNAGTSVKMNIDDYLQQGTNVITLLVRGRSTGTTKTQVVTYYVVQLDISTTFDISRSITPNSDFGVTYTVVGETDKTVQFYIDGRLVTSYLVSSLEQTATKTQIFTNLDGKYAPGKHSLQVRAFMMAGDQQFYSKLLYYEFVITGIEQTVTLISYEYPNTQQVLVGQLPGLHGEQYVTQSINWAYYSSDPLLQTATVTWRLYTEGGVETTLATRNADVVQAETDKKPDPLQFMPTETGDYNLQSLVNDNIVESYTISVIPNTNGIIETTEGLVMKLSGLGRSNDEPEETRTSWSNRGYSCTFTNMPFNGSAGYVDNAVVFNNGATGVIDCKPYAQEIAVQSNNGNCVEIDFETFNVDDNDAVLFRIGNIASGPCLWITPQKAVLRSRNGVTIEQRFKSDERIKIAMIVHPNSQDHTSYPKMMFMVTNGILSRAQKYDISEIFNIGENASSEDYGKIYIGDSEGGAGIKIYYLRVYRSTISTWQELNNYIIDFGTDIANKIQRNDVFQLGVGSAIDVDKIEGFAALMKITGDVTPMIQTTEKVTVNARIEYTDPEDSNRNFTTANARLKNAGQSTLGYRMSPSMHVNFNSNEGNVIYDRDGKPLAKNRWAFNSKNVPERKLRLQANSMDSSVCHNGAFLKMVNAVYPNVDINGEHVLRTPLQEYIMSGKYAQDMARVHGGSSNDYTFPYTINMVPDSKPVVIVWRPDENSTYRFLGDYIMMEEKKANYANGMHSVYDKMLDDGTLDPFDFYAGKKSNRLWDNVGCRQVENLREENLNLFNSAAITDWNKANRELAYEYIFPEEEDIQADYTSGKSNMTIDAYWNEFYNEVIKPISQTYQNQSAFDSIIFTVLDKWHLAAYYCLVMRQCCTDSLVRNLEWVRYTTDGKWLPKWWDVDMQLGLQQSGDCNAQPTTDRNTRIGNFYVMSGRTPDHSSWLWDGLEGCTEFQEAVVAMDQALYDAGWTYNNIQQIQDEQYVNKFSETLYNLDQEQKYIESYFNGDDHLVALQGDRTPHRHWFQRTSYDYWDSKHVVGEYKSRNIYIRARQSANKHVYLVAGQISYFGWGRTTTVVESGIYADKGDTITFTIPSGGIIGNDPLNIYAANKIQEIDLHEIAENIWSAIDVEHCYDPITGTCLKKLVAGISKEDMANDKINSGNSVSFSGINKIDKLEWLDLQGLQDILTLDLSNNYNLKTLHAAGSSLIAYNPADGSNVEDIQLPDTVASITASGCNFTYNNACAITWWNKADQITLPTSLTVLHLTGMGRDVGTQDLIHQWLQMLNNNPSVIPNAQIQINNIYWENVDWQDLYTLARIPATQRTVTGYVKCTTEYTTEQMNILMNAFGENCFSLSNAMSGLCCDCDSTRIIVSASGDPNYVTVDSSGQDPIIQITQGADATLQAVGFPLIEAAVTYKWFINDGERPRTGSEQMPLITFGQNTMHWKTGVINTTECSAAATTYNIYVQSISSETNVVTADGSAQIKIVPRTYPSSVSITYDQDASQNVATTDPHSGHLQIITPGSYMIRALHSPSVYSGTRLDQDGETWTVTGLSDYGTGDTTTALQYGLTIQDFPEDESTVTIRYQSHWKNGSTITSGYMYVDLIHVINGILTAMSLGGNPSLYATVHQYFEDNGYTHTANTFNSLELKQVAGTIHFGSDLEDTLSGDNREYNIIKYLKNVTGFDFSGTAITDDIDTSLMPQATSIDISNTVLDSIQFNNHSNIASIHTGAITSLVLNNCPSVTIDLTYSDKSQEVEE